MKNFSHLRQYYAEFFVEWDMFQKKVVEKIHILCSVDFSRKSCRLWDVEKYGGYGEVADVMAPARGILGTYGYSRASTRPSSCTDTHPRARTHARTRMPSLSPQRAHAHTEICNTYCFSTARAVSWTRLNVTIHVECLPCFNLIIFWSYTDACRNIQFCLKADKRKWHFTWKSTCVSARLWSLIR